MLALQIVPYFMTGFESVTKGSEEARTGFDPRSFGRAMYARGRRRHLLLRHDCRGRRRSCSPGGSWWPDTSGRRPPSSAPSDRARSLNLIFLAAFLSLLKVFNGNFVAATRLLFAVGRRGLVHPSLGRVHPRFGTPSGAIALVAVLTAGAAFLGDAVLVPITEVGSLAAGIGWLSACGRLPCRARRGEMAGTGRGWVGVATACLASAVALAVIAMKILPAVPGSFDRTEWGAFLLWSLLGFLFWLARRRKE